MFLPDVNVLLALMFEAHQHHPPAREWFDGIPDDSGMMCRMTQTALLRLATNPALFGREALRLSEAWVCYDSLMDDPRLEYALEPLGLDHLWRRLTTTRSYSPKVWNDAYLAAFARAGGLTVVTFDKAFRSVPDLEVQILHE